MDMIPCQNLKKYAMQHHYAINYNLNNKKTIQCFIGLCHTLSYKLIVNRTLDPTFEIYLTPFNKQKQLNVKIYFPQLTINKSVHHNIQLPMFSDHEKEKHLKRNG